MALLVAGERVLATGTGRYGHAEGDRLAGIEDLVGSDYDDTLGGGAGANRLYGGTGSSASRLAPQEAPAAPGFAAARRGAPRSGHGNERVEPLAFRPRRLG